MRESFSSLLHKCAQAYAAGDPNADEHYKLVHPMITRVIEGRLKVRKNNEADQEEATQDAILRVWRALREGRVPDVGQAASSAAIDKYRKTGQGDARRLPQTAVDHIRNPVDIDQIVRWADETSSEDDPTLLETTHKYRRHAKHISESPTGHDSTIFHTLTHTDPSWGIVAVYLSEGFKPAEIATRIGMKSSDVTVIVNHIRNHIENQNGS